MDSPIAVIGGTGRLGRLVTRRLLARGESVRVLGRNVQRARRHLPAQARFFVADVRDPDAVRAPLYGCAAVVYAVEPGTDATGPDSPEATLYGGVRHVLDALNPPSAALDAAAGGPHVVLVSQRHVTHRDHPMNAYGRMLDWRLAGEDAVRASGLPYTVIRPGWLTDETGDGPVHLEQGDLGDGRVARAHVADACVQALYSPAARGVTFEMRGEPGPSAGDIPWEELFHALRADAPATARAVFA
ncbi:SDR family oxidoreductase [Streptomyces sp. NPDC006393]|uniref:SDR family oxidoreductase n=1 Tax=Streptomyces sp. NPDC006393 TaxID=3156763 RepID=UPI0033F13C77